MADIVFRNVTKRYGQTIAVDNASFSINDNEFFCFFGPPLSGKSTILRLILGLEAPDSGDILIGGREVNRMTPADRNVAMVFQNLALFPHMTAKENVRFPLVERRVSEAAIEKRVAEVSAKLHIGHILHKPPALLSGGERQRVAIARALVRDPSAYLMDDPISALDARFGRRLGSSSSGSSASSVRRSSMSRTIRKRRCPSRTAWRSSIAVVFPKLARRPRSMIGRRASMWRVNLARPR